MRLWLYFRSPAEPGRHTLTISLPVVHTGRIRQIEDELGEGPSDAGVGVLVPKPLTDEDAT